MRNEDWGREEEFTTEEFGVPRRSRRFTKEKIRGKREKS